MAITGTKLFASGDVLTAADTNQYLMRGVKVYSSTAVRDAAYGGAGEPTLEEGETCYITADDELQTYDGSSWVKIGPSVAPAILQVVSTTKTDTFTTSSTSFVDLTGLSLSITPSSASNKVLLFVDVQGVSGVATGDVTSSIKLLRDSTDIAVGDAAGSRTQSFAGFGLPEGYNRNEQLFYTTTAGINFLDSPATSSAITYKLQVRAAGATLFINRSGQDDNSANYNRMVSSITAMEVSA